MKVLHLNTHAEGGSYVYAAALSQALSEMGVDSKVITREMSGRPFLDKVLRRATLSLSLGAWHGTRRKFLPPDLEMLEGADVVHLHTVADWFDVPRWVRALPRSVRLVVGLHDLWHVSGGCFVHGRCERFRADCRPCPLLRAPANLLLAANELQRKTRAYRDAGARFVANSRWLRDTVKDSPVLRGLEITVVPPPVDPAVFHPQDRGRCRTRFGLNRDNLVVATGCASLADANKDTPGLLRMLAELKLPELKVLMFGDGEIAIPNGLDVHRCGPIREKQKLAMIYGAADLFVSASRMETYGLTLAEAYSCGCGVVAHDTGGIPEALPRDPSVALVPLGDRGAFVDAMREQLRRCAAESPAIGIGRARPCAPSPRQAIGMLAEVYGAA